MALITLDEAKEYLRVDTDADDALVGSLLLSAGRLCADVISLRASLRVAVYFTLAYLYEHREEADHHGLLLTLRSLLFSVREGRP